MEHRGDRMVGGKRIQLCLQIHIWSVDPYPGVGGLQNIHLHMHLCNWGPQCRAPIDNRMLTEEYDLAGG
jgi:hypothetical protein